MRRSIFAALFALAACRPSLSTPVSCPDAGTTLTYESFGADFMTGYCIACHGNSRIEKGVDLTTAAGIAAHRSAIVNEVGGGSMPPTGSPAPTDAERAQIVEWLGCSPAAGN
jgi:mono/diheme cytochrome c family protein